jgi:two-component system sensor histidine kinase ChvG
MTLKAKFNLLSVFVLLSPLAGWLVINLSTEYLLDSQIHSVNQRARSIGEALSSFGPTIFESAKTFRPALLPYPKRTSVQIIKNSPPTIDGNLSDWDVTQTPEEFLEPTMEWPRSKNFAGKYLIGRFQDRIYIGMRIEASGKRRFTDGLDGVDVEQIYLSSISQTDEFKQFLIKPRKNGQVVIKQRSNTEPWSIASYSEIRGEVRELGIRNSDGELSSVGYELELEIARHIIGSAMCLVVSRPDVSNQLRTCENHLDRNELSAVQVNSPDIEPITESFANSDARIAVVDAQSYIQHEVPPKNSINTDRAAASPPHDNTSTQIDSFFGLWPTYLRFEFSPWEIDNGKLNNDQVANVLATGNGSIAVNTSEGIRSYISAAHPIVTNGKIVGAIIFQESTNDVFAVRYQFVKGLTFGTLLIIILYLPVHFLFFGRITRRLSALANVTSESIDENGRVVKTIDPDMTQDEIGDVSQNLAEISARLKNYTDYLENFARRLSHELRTPLAGLQSSLDLIKKSDNFEEATRYINRAEAGVERLNRILTKMSEASDLEASFQSERLEPLDLSKLIILSVEDYREIYRPRDFEVIVTEKQIIVDGSADSLRQMLDKIVENANDFGIPQTSIVISINVLADRVILQIMNSGPTIPNEKRMQIFDSLVSDRSGRSGGSSHLGLGLYVARIICEFHNGNISVRNRSDGGGVTFEISLPHSQS